MCPSKRGIGDCKDVNIKLLIVILISATCGMYIDRYFSFYDRNLRKLDDIITKTPPMHKEPHHHERDHDYDACDPRNFLVLVMSGAKATYQKRRRIWRDGPCPASYAAHNITYRFIIAMPAHETIDPNTHNQGKVASSIEISDMAVLRDEYRDNGDVVFLSMKDVYEDLSLKTLRGIEWAVDKGMTKDTSIVVKHDDEYCLRTEVLRGICLNSTGSGSSLYAGWYLWSSAGWEIQKGIDGSFVPYFSGYLYALSSDLARDIAYDPNSVLEGMNAPSAEDLQMGRWVNNQANRTDRERRIDYVTEPSLLWELEGME